MHAIDKVNAYIVVLYYALVTALILSVRHPILLGILFVGGTVLSFVKAGWRVTLRYLAFALIMSLLMVLINPLVSKEGVTHILEYGDFYITLESVVYGLISSLMLSAVVMWFVSFNVVMTGDKYIYVLGRFLPSFALLISITLRLIPELSRRTDDNREYARSMGMYSGGDFVSRLKLNVHAIRATIVHSIEASAIRADSMEARGYGVAHRTSCLVCRWRLSDSIFAIGTLTLGGMAIAGHVLGYGSASYYPAIVLDTIDSHVIGAIVVMVAYVMLPIILEIVEGVRWQRYLSETSA